MVEHKRKDQLVTIIVLDGLRVLWDEFGYRFYVMVYTLRAPPRA
jgi:hypothetical protein